VVGLISNNGETHYRREVNQLATWCINNNLFLNVETTKEIVVDFRRTSTQHPHPLTINDAAVEQVSCTKFLGVHRDLFWSNNTTSLAKKAQQRLDFVHKLKRANCIFPKILK